MFGSIIDEFGLCKTILAYSGKQFTSEKFRKKCREAEIYLLFSCPYHYQANSLAERTIGIVKALCSSMDVQGHPHLNSHLPSSCCLTRSHEHCYRAQRLRWHQGIVMSTDISANQLRQETQTRHYKADGDQRPLDPDEPIDIYHTITKVWEPGNIVTRPSDAEARKYLVERDGKQLQRTREHIRLRKAPMPRKLHTSIANPVKTTEPTPTEPEPTKPDDTPVKPTPETITANKRQSAATSEDNPIWPNNTFTCQIQRLKMVRVYIYV